MRKAINADANVDDRLFPFAAHRKASQYAHRRHKTHTHTFSQENQ